MYPGTPDVEFSLGFIELKHVERPPVRSSTIVRIPHYTTEQRLFARQRASAGGVCLLLLQCGAEVFIIDGPVAARSLGIDATMGDIRKMAVEKWGMRPSPRELLTAVVRHSKPHLPKNLSFSEDDAVWGCTTHLPTTT